MARRPNYSLLLSRRDWNAAQDKRTKLYSVFTGIKRKPRATKKALTHPQLVQRLKFGMVVSFVKHLKLMVNIGLRKKTIKMTASNYATKLILSKAIIGDYPDFSINYAILRFTFGNLSECYIDNSSITTEGVLTMKWEEFQFRNMVDDNKDEVFIFLYDSMRKLSHNFSNAALRSDKSVQIKIPSFAADTDYHVWMFMVSPDQRNASRSQYFKIRI